MAAPSGSSAAVAAVPVAHHHLLMPTMPNPAATARPRPRRPLGLFRRRLVLAGVLTAGALGLAACGTAGGSSKTGSAALSRSTCAAQLTLTVMGPTSTGGGGSSFQVVLTNDLGAACTIQGYPTVTLQDAASGTTIGRPMGHAAGTAGLVHLAHGAAAVATVTLRPGAGAGCTATSATGLVVSPPAESDIHMLERLPAPVTACLPSKGGSQAPGTVTPLTLEPTASPPGNSGSAAGGSGSTGSTSSASSSGGSGAAGSTSSVGSSGAASG